MVLTVADMKIHLEASGLDVPWLAELIWESKLPAKIHVLSIFLSLAVAVGVGVLFGWYPARRAALLDPIEALRHE